MKAKRRGVSIAPPTIPKIQKVVFASSQQNRAIMRQNPKGRENLTFDAVPAGYMVADNIAVVAVSASGYLTAGASAHVLNQVPQGTTSTTRIGRKMKMTKLRILGHIASGSTSATQVARVALVYIPRMTDTVTTMPPQDAIWGTQNSLAHRVLNNSDRYKVIREWRFLIGGQNSAPSAGTEAYSIDEMIDINRQTVWTKEDTTGSFDNMKEGALCLYVNGTLNGNGARLTYQPRLYFEDL